MKMPNTTFDHNSDFMPSIQHPKTNGYGASIKVIFGDSTLNFKSQKTDLEQSEMTDLWRIFCEDANRYSNGIAFIDSELLRLNEMRVIGCRLG